MTVANIRSFYLPLCCLKRKNLKAKSNNNFWQTITVYNALQLMSEFLRVNEAPGFTDVKTKVQIIIRSTRHALRYFELLISSPWENEGNRKYHHLSTKGLVTVISSPKDVYGSISGEMDHNFNLHRPKGGWSKPPSCFLWITFLKS